MSHSASITQRASEFSDKILRKAVLLSSIIGAFVEHNRYIFGAVQHSIIGEHNPPTPTRESLPVKLGHASMVIRLA